MTNAIKKLYYNGMNLLTDNTVCLWIADLGIWPLIVVLVPNLTFRRYGKDALKKRLASLYQAIAVFLVTSMAVLCVERELADIYFWSFLVLIIAVLWIIRGKVFPYRSKCAECGEKLGFNTIYYMDDNLCPGCHEKHQEEHQEEDASLQNDGPEAP